LGLGFGPPGVWGGKLFRPKGGRPKFCELWIFFGETLVGGLSLGDLFKGGLFLLRTPFKKKGNPLFGEETGKERRGKERLPFGTL